MLKDETRQSSWVKSESDVAIALVFLLGQEQGELSTILPHLMASIKQHRTWPRTISADTAA
jgi:hypothetical protein